MSVFNLSIQDLCNQSGIPRRTIHFYLQLGLLPPPEGNGPAARYGDQHLLQLRLILWLRSQGNRLDNIRKIFNSSTSADFLALEKRMTAAPLPEAPACVSSTPCRIYSFTSGVELVVHENLSPVVRQQVEELLEASQKIFLSKVIGG